MAMDLTGQRFGKLVVVGLATCKGNARVWRCACDCGGETEAGSRPLVSGDRKSCGCLVYARAVEMIGKKFGTLLIVGFAGKVKGQRSWHCRRDCGAETIVSGRNLRSFNTQTCGAVVHHWRRRGW